MADTNINIIFRQTDASGSESDPTAPGATPNPENPTDQQENSGKGASFSTKAIALYIGKQAINMATSRVSQITGSNVLQEKVNAGLKVAGYAVAIATNPVMGVLALGVDVANSVIDYNINASKENSAMVILNTRAGNINRSR